MSLRAASVPVDCSLSLVSGLLGVPENYGSCVRDCAAVLGIPSPSASNPSEQYQNTTRKALFRSSKALLALGKFDEALNALECMKGLPSTSSSTLTTAADLETDKLLDSIQRKIQHELKLSEDKQKVVDAQRQKDAALTLRLQVRFQHCCVCVLLTCVWQDLKVKLPSSWTPAKARKAAPQDMEAVHLDDEALPETELALFPVFLLRPYASPPTRDLIPEWAEDVLIAQQIESLSEQDPSFGEDLEVYTVTAKGRVLKLGKSLSMAQVLKAAWKAEVNDGMGLVDSWCVELYLVPKERGAEFVAETKANLKARGLVQV